LSDTFKKILEAREDRWLRKKDLAENYSSSIVCLTMNIPGPEKAGDLSLRAFEILVDEFLGILEKKETRILYQERKITADGPEMIIVADADPWELKKIGLSVEESHILGRIADIDVLDRSGNPVSRKDLGIRQRKCLICDRPARECAVLGRHDRSEVIEKAMAIIRYCSDS
jgi:holo-ACP synthase CitX